LKTITYKRKDPLENFKLMKKIAYIVIFLITSIQCVLAQEIPIPKGYSVVDTITGDLDKDSIKELVVAYNTDIASEFGGFHRELSVYKLENNAWKLWKTSQQALYGSKDGGMMGDPFDEMRIKEGILHISQNGGSSWKWGFTDKYRFQDGAFYLIGYTSISGKICEYWRDVDFNLLTGKMIVKKEFKNCKAEESKIYKTENETFYRKGLKITMDKRLESEILITTPKYGHKIYIAIDNK